MKLIYLAGPYSSSLGYQIQLNIHQAFSWGLSVALVGGFPVIPHLNTAHFDGIQNYDFFLRGTRELMLKCDAVLMLPGYEDSAGAKDEEGVALANSMPIFYVTSTGSLPAALIDFIKGV